MSTTITTSNDVQENSIVRRIMDRFKNFMTTRNACSELSSLSDRELQDIGLSRGDIPYLFTNRFTARARNAG